jgi:RNA-directed DNA polymerase
MNISHNSSTVPSNTGNAYNLNSNNGNINNDNKTNDNNNGVRCVRSEKDTIFGIENIFKAYEECRKRKRNTINALKFEQNLEQNLFELHSLLNNRKYVPRRSVCFIVLKPKPREIFAADFRDRIVHHILVSELEKIYEKRFIFDSYACRKNKGTHKAVKRLKKFTQSYSNNNKTYKRGYFLQLDIQNFFMSIDKKILFNLIKKQIKKSKLFSKNQKQELLFLLNIVIFSNPEKNFIKKSKGVMWKKVPNHKSLFNTEKNKGLPIGNYSSQFFANIYLHELDFFVKQKLGIKHYVRYVDDFILLSRRKDFLLSCFFKILFFVKNKLLLDLKKESKLLSISNGIDFLGYIIRPWSIYVRKRVIINFKAKIKDYNKLIQSNELDDFDKKQFKATKASYFGHFKHANFLRIKKEVLGLIPS